jgi:hypothetical protein
MPLGKFIQIDDIKSLSSLHHGYEMYHVCSPAAAVADWIAKSSWNTTCPANRVVELDPPDMLCREGVSKNVIIHLIQILCC